MVSCSTLTKDNEPRHATHDEKLIQVLLKRERYCDLSKKMYERDGYVNGKCDSLLFTALHSIGCGYVSLSQFESKEEPGRYFRSPTHDCFIPPDTDNGSKSTLSRDMVLGLLLNFWHEQDLDGITRFLNFSIANDWDFCGGDAISSGVRRARCIASPTIKATVYEVAVALGHACNTTCKTARKVPQVWNPHEDGFRAHLLNLHILLRGVVMGAINDNQVEQLEYQARTNPKNALYSATYHLFTDGDMAGAMSSLLDTNYFPIETLPTSKNYCAEYLFQRDQFLEDTLDFDWLPCPEESIIHSGTDFIFAASIVLGDLK